MTMTVYFNMTPLGFATTPDRYSCYTNYKCILGLQVSLGIHLKNENKTDEMADIMEHLQQYVPSKRISELFQVSESKEVAIEIDYFCHILFGGDQLTVACARGAQGVLCNSHNGFDRLEGLVPVVEDWYAKVTLMKVNPRSWLPACTMTANVMQHNILKQNLNEQARLSTLTSSISTIS